MAEGRETNIQKESSDNDKQMQKLLELSALIACLYLEGFSCSPELGYTLTLV